MSTSVGGIHPQPYSNFDKFIFVFQLTCSLPNRQSTWFTAQFIENDTFGSGEWITERYEGTFHKSEQRIFYGEMNGDEMFSDGYSVTAILQHDCTTSGESVEFQIEFEQLCIIGKTCQMNYHVHLDDQSGHINIMTQVY